MLPRGNRLTGRTEYRAVVRGGRRCVSESTIAYIVASDSERDPRFGFIVGKNVGSAVTRNTVRRRLKAVCHELAPDVRRGTEIVVRALPISATTPFGRLRADLTRCMQRRGVT